MITCTTFNRFFRNDVGMDADNARRKEIYESWLKNGNFLKQFGSVDEDLESQFGMYEFPCIYVMRNSAKVPK